MSTRRSAVALLTLLCALASVSPAVSAPLEIRHTLVAFSPQGRETAVAYALEVRNPEGTLSGLVLRQVPGLFLCERCASVAFDRLGAQERREVTVSFTFPSIMTEQQAREVTIEWIASGTDDAGASREFPVTALPAPEIAAE